MSDSVLFAASEAACPPDNFDGCPADSLRTDLGLARRLVWRYGNSVRYCHTWKSWLIWDGRRWKRDDSGEARRLMQQTALAIMDEAKLKPTGSDQQKDLMKFAMKCQSARAIEAGLSLAESQMELSVTSGQLNQDPWKLNVRNGTLNLKTGDLLPHCREDLLTAMCPVEFDGAASHALWDKFLGEATGGDLQLAAFLRRAAGYSLTGDTGEEKLLFLHGPAATGKTTFIEALKAVIGDYAATADFETFLARSQVGGPRNDIARLAGRRFVASVEVDEGKRLAEGLVKMITGGDTVAARFLYQEAFDFRPQFKLWLAANHAPAVRDDDEALWRRILTVPFRNVVPAGRRDPTVKAMLRDPDEAGPAVLAWAVRGCLEWQRDGLGVPMAVEQATQAYRATMDPLAEFFADRCRFGEGLKVTRRSLRDAYALWVQDHGERALSEKDLYRRLRERGVRECGVTEGGRGVRGFEGMGLLATEAS